MQYIALFSLALVSLIVVESQILEPPHKFPNGIRIYKMKTDDAESILTGLQGAHFILHHDGSHILISRCLVARRKDKCKAGNLRTYYPFQPTEEAYTVPVTEEGWNDLGNKLEFVFGYNDWREQILVKPYCAKRPAPGTPCPYSNQPPSAHPVSEQQIMTKYEQLYQPQQHQSRPRKLWNMIKSPFTRNGP